jgi:hypothetical protein
LGIDAHDLTDTTKWYNLSTSNFTQNKSKNYNNMGGKNVEDGIVKVRLTGACGGCPMSQMTLKQGIEAHVRKKIPEIVSVESV